MFKCQRADMYREIYRIRDVMDMNTKAAFNQIDRLKALEYDL